LGALRISLRGKKKECENSIADSSDQNPLVREKGKEGGRKTIKILKQWKNLTVKKTLQSMQPSSTSKHAIKIF
jgi:hypothetical protein